MNKWQPIDTAPKDGSAIIVWPSTWKRVTSCAQWYDDRYAKTPRPYWKRFDAVTVSNSRDNPPTHWMPVLDGPDKNDE